MRTLKFTQNNTVKNCQNGVQIPKYRLHDSVFRFPSCGSVSAKVYKENNDY